MGVIGMCSSVPGQGGTPFRREFVNHAVGTAGSVIYDPSYGLSYTTKIAWEDGSVEYFSPPLRHDQKGVLETVFNPDVP